MKKYDWTYHPLTGTQLLDESPDDEDLEFGRSRCQALVIILCSSALLVIGSIGCFLAVVEWVLP